MSTVISQNLPPIFVMDQESKYRLKEPKLLDKGLVISTFKFQ